MQPHPGLQATTDRAGRPRSERRGVQAARPLSAALRSQAQLTAAFFSHAHRGLGAWIPCALFPDALYYRECWRSGMRQLMYYFAMQREIETVALRVPRHAEADKHLDHEEDDQAGDGIIYEHGGAPDALIEELTNISSQNARRSAVLLDCEHSGQQRPDDAANRMHAE